MSESSSFIHHLSETQAGMSYYNDSFLTNTIANAFVGLSGQGPTLIATSGSEGPSESTNGVLTNLSYSLVNTPTEELELRTLLCEWKLENLADELIAQKVFISILKIIKRHHIERLLKNFDMGSQISFEHNLEQWRETIGMPLLPLMGTTTGSHSTSLSIPPSPSPVPSNISLASPRSEQHVSPFNNTQSPSPYENSNSINIRLSTILNGSPKGKILVDFYNKFSSFQEEQRNSLIALIAHYFEERGLKLSLSASYQLEKEILDKFPSEKLEYYRTERRGRIYSKYYNSVTTFKRGVSKYVMETKPTTTQKRSRHESILLLEPEEDAETCLRALKFDNLTAEQFDAVWKACWGYRQHFIKNSKETSEIIAKWPFYKTPSGYRLIDMDFKLAFSSCNMDGLLEDYDKVLRKIYIFLTTENHVKDKSVKTLLEKLEDATISENGRHAASIWALHGYFVPTTKIIKKDVTGKKSTTKFTIKDSQESVIFVGDNLIEVEDRINHLKRTKQSLQPSIYGIGKNIFEIDEMFIHFDGIRFKFTNIVRALDICFKLIYLFNLEFPLESEMFFSFLECYFYKMKPTCKYSKVQILCGYLNTSE